MTNEQAASIVKTCAKKHTKFRHIETIMTDRGCNITFADIPDIDPRTISNWLRDAGALVLYIGRQWKINGFVMHAELRME